MTSSSSAASTKILTSLLENKTLLLNLNLTSPTTLSSNTEAIAAYTSTLNTAKQLQDADIDSPELTEQIKNVVIEVVSSYFHYFITHQSAALDVVMDLIEDASLAIRCSAITSLKSIATNTPACISKCSDILTQLLLTNQQVEQTLVQQIFRDIYSIDPVSCLLVLLLNCKEEDNHSNDHESEGAVDEEAESKALMNKLSTRALNFLMTLLTRRHHRSQLNRALDKQIIKQQQLAAALKHFLTSSATFTNPLSAHDFKELLSLFASIKSVKDQNSVLMADLSEIVETHSQINKEFPSSSSVRLQQQACTAFTLGLSTLTFLQRFQINLAPKFLQFYLLHLAPILIASTSSSSSSSSSSTAFPLSFKLKLSLYRALSHVMDKVDFSLCRKLIEAIWKACVQELRLVQAVSTSSPFIISTSPNGISASSIESYSLLECLLRSLHKLCSQSSDSAVFVLGLVEAQAGQPINKTLEAKKIETVKLCSSAHSHAQVEITTLNSSIKALKEKLKTLSSSSSSSSTSSTDTEARKTAQRLLSEANTNLMVVKNVATMLNGLISKPAQYLSDPTCSFAHPPQKKDASSAKKIKAEAGDAKAKVEGNPGNKNDADKQSKKRKALVDQAAVASTSTEPASQKKQKQPEPSAPDAAHEQGNASKKKQKKPKSSVNQAAAFSAPSSSSSSPAIVASNGTSNKAQNQVPNAPAPAQSQTKQNKKRKSESLEASNADVVGGSQQRKQKKPKNEKPSQEANSASNASTTSDLLFAQAQQAALANAYLAQMQQQALQMYNPMNAQMQSSQQPRQQQQQQAKQTHPHQQKQRTQKKQQQSQQHQRLLPQQQQTGNASIKNKSGSKK